MGISRSRVVALLSSLFLVALCSGAAVPDQTQTLRTDVTSKLFLNRSLMFYDFSTRTSFWDSSITNLSRDTLPAPITVVVEGITPAGISVANPDGYTPEGKPYYDYSGQIGTNGMLTPLETSRKKTWRFYNPNLIKFSFTYRVYANYLAPDNVPPEITITNPVDNGVLSQNTPQITIQYHDDISGVDLQSMSVTIDGVDMTAAFGVTENYAMYTPPHALAGGMHQIEVMLSDQRGNTNAVTSSFRVIASTRPMQYLFSLKDNPWIFASAGDGTYTQYLSPESLGLSEEADVNAISKPTWCDEIFFTLLNQSGIYRSTGDGSYHQYLSNSRLGLCATVGIDGLDVGFPGEPILFSAKGYKGIYKTLGTGSYWTYLTGTQLGVSCCASVDALEKDTGNSLYFHLSGQSDIYKRSNCLNSLALGMSDLGVPGATLDAFAVLPERNKPSITVTSPACGSMLKNNTPLIAVSFGDTESGVDKNSFSAKLDGVDLTQAFTVCATGASYQIPACRALADGNHLLNVSIDDRACNTGSALSSFTVAVHPPPTVSITADPGAIMPGSSSVLTWTSSNADTLGIDNGIGAVAAGGSITVSPTATTTYTITATGPGGTASKSATITVIQPPPTAGIAVEPSTIISGASAVLSWTTTNADTVTIDKGIGAVAPSGSRTVSPTTTTTYTITATGPGGTATGSATVTVMQAPRVSITATPDTIAAGAASTLSWTSTNADSATLDNDIGPVAPGGSLPVTPSQTTTYTITVTGPGGAATANVTVSVHQVPTVTLSAVPGSIPAGDTSLLSWTSSDADSVSIDQFIGPVSLSGSMPVSPSETTTYTVIATGPGGTATASATVDVETVTPAHKPYAYITNALDNDVSVLDLQTNTVIGRIKLGDPVETPIAFGSAVSPDGDMVYIASQAGGINVIDAATNTVVNNLPVPAAALAFSPDGKVLYAVNTDDGTLSSILVSSGTVIGSISVGPSPQGIAVNNEGTRIYVSSLEDGQVREIEVDSLSITGAFPVTGTFDAIRDLAMSIDGSLLYALSAESCKLTVIDTQTHAVLDSRHYLIEVWTEDCHIAVSPNGEKIVVTDTLESLQPMTITLIDGRTLDVLNKIPASGATAPDFRADGASVYVPDFVLHGVHIIDGQTTSVAGTVEDGFAYPCAGGRFIAEHKELISGRVVEGGNGIPGVLVTLSNEHIKKTYLTDTQGVYFFYAPSGSYTITYQSDDHILATSSRDVSVADRGLNVADVGVVLGVRIWSEPAAIIAGSSAVLHWDALHATSVSIDQGIGAVGSSGSLSISPGESTLYTITADDALGHTVSDRAQVVVYQKPTVTLTIDPPTVVSGQACTISWTSANAESVSLGYEGHFLSVPLSGSLSGYPEQSGTITITITATGPGGTATDSVTVTVVAAQPEVSLTATPDTIYAGESSLLAWASTNADQVSIDNGIGLVDLNGSMSVNPAHTTTYTITATGPGGSQTMAATVTVNAAPPELSISATPATIHAGLGESSTLAWTSLHAELVEIDNGIGAVEPNGSLAVSPAQTTTYTITATGPGGVISRSVTVTAASVISLAVLTPVNGAAIDRPDILVSGTLENLAGHETGVTVNGLPATVYQGRFFVNHVPLAAGDNTIIVAATDAGGNTNELSITVSADIEQPYITLSPTDYTGIAPYESVLTVESPFTPDSISFTDDSAGEIQYLDGAEEGQRIAGISSQGCYFITAGVSISGAVLTDTVGIVAYDADALDAILRHTWESMRTALLAGDIEAAVKDISSRTQNAYRTIFTALTPEQRAGLVAELGDIQLIKTRFDGVEYDIQTTRNGTLYSFFLWFEVDTDGRWKIANF